jgi:hypothetical protein
MSYVSPKQLFINDRIEEGCEVEDILFLADLEFDDSGEPRSGSIYETYQRKQ